MGLVICIRCGNVYNRDIWDECPNCPRHLTIPKPHIIEQEFRAHNRQEIPMHNGCWDLIPYQYNPHIYINDIRRIRL